MEYAKPNPKGLDIHIGKVQSFIYGRLKSLWNVTDASFDCYARAYRNQTADGYIPEVYKGSKEYKEVFFDDKLAAISFFGVAENIRYTMATATAPVYLIFMVDLSKIKSGDYRMDEEAHVDVQKLFQPGRSGFNMTGFSTGIDSVFKEYSGWRKEQGMKFRDMHPLHCFRIDFLVSYDINQC